MVTMDESDSKLNQYYGGKVVRKDLIIYHVAASNIDQDLLLRIAN